MRVSVRLIACWMLLSLVTGCHEVYEELAPSQKLQVTMILLPELARQGDAAVQVEAFLDVSNAGTFVTDVDFGEGVTVLAFDTTGCDFGEPPASFTSEEPFQLCLTLEVSQDAVRGERTATLELRTSQGPAIARTVFFVLRALQ